MASPEHEPESKQVLETQLRATLDVIPAYTWYTSPSGALTFVNQRCADYVGLPEDHPLRSGRNTGAAWDSHIPLLHPDDHEETRRVWSTCLRTGCAGEVSFRVRNGQGQYRWFLSRAEPLRGSDGTLLYWIGINIDIEERKRAELFLAEGQRLAHTGSWAFDSAGFEYWSSELFQIHGLDLNGNAPTKEEYLALVHPEDREFVDQEIHKMLATHRGFDFTKRIVRPDGAIRRVRFVGSPATQGGSFQGFVGAGVDVTEQEQLTRELQRREAYLAEAQRLSHTGSFGWRVSSGEIFWSDETFRIFQCDPSTPPALAFDIARVHSDDRDRVQQQIDRASCDGKAFNFENRLQMPDGTIKYVRVTARPFSDISGDLEFVGAVTDISSEEGFRLIVETIPGLIAVMTAEGEVAHVSHQVLDYFGRTLEELKKWGTTDAVHPADLPAVAAAWKHAVETGSPYEVEHRLRRADGEYRWFVSRGLPLRDADGHIVRWYNLLTDIHVRKQSEESLQRSEVALQKALEEIKKSEADLLEAQRLSHTGSWRHDVLTGIVTISPEVHRIFDIRPAEDASTARFFFSRIHPEDRPIEAQNYERANLAKTDFESDYRIVLPDGAIKHVHNVGHPVLNQLGDIREFVGTVIDITERKRAEDTIRWVVDTIPTLAWCNLPDGSNEFLNKRWRDYTGLSTEESSGWGWQVAVHPEDLPPSMKKWQEWLTSGEPGETEVRLRRFDGVYRWFLIRVEPFRDEAGWIVRWYGTSTDIEDRKQAEDKLRRSEWSLLEAQRLGHSVSWHLDVATGIVSNSPEVIRIFDIRPGEDYSRQEFYYNRIHPEDRKRTQEHFEKCAAEKTEWQADFRLLLPNGTIKYHRTIGHPILNEAGDLVEVVGTGIDTTEYVQGRIALEKAFDEIKKSEAKIRQVVDAIPTLAWCNLPDGPNEFLNKRWRDYTGLSTEESTGWGWQVAFHPEELPPLMKKWQELLVSGEPGEIEARLRRFDGVYRWFLISVEPFRDEAGRIVRWYGTSTEIEERKQAEDRLREENVSLKRAEEKIRGQEAELGQMLEFTPQLVRVFGADHERIYANRIALDYLGVSLEEWRQIRGISSFVHPDDEDRMRASFDGARSVGAAFELEVRLRKADGSYRWFLVRYNPVRDNKGQIMRWYVASTDIEDRKQAEDRLQCENVALREEIDKASMFEEIVGASPALRAVLSRISKVAPSDSTVLITGETGTGKELVARAIHRRSNRASRAFVNVNCAAIPRELIASELFGHEKGAYTGATHQRLGRFELANGGTIFLDEVGELPAETQVALLRVLQEREFERVGGTRRIPADVRVIAATNRDLRAAIRAGSFRSDLFFRLHVFPIVIPPLRERQRDIPLLVEYFIDRYARKTSKNIKGVGKKTLELLQSYAWPGNIRELQNVIERSLILCDTEIFSIDESWLPQEPFLAESKNQIEPFERLWAQEKNMIEAALKESRGRVSGPHGAAAKLRIPRSTLESKIKSLKIDKNRFRTVPGT